MLTSIYPMAEAYQKSHGCDCLALPVLPAWYVFSHSGFTGPFASYHEVSAYIAIPEIDPLYPNEMIVEVTEPQFKALTATAIAFFDPDHSLSDKPNEEYVRGIGPNFLGESDEELDAALEAVLMEQRDRRRVKSMQDFLAEMPEGPGKDIARENPSLDGGYSPVLPGGYSPVLPGGRTLKSMQAFVDLMSNPGIVVIDDESS